MKVGLISDVHCNADALTRVFARMQDCDEVLCAGDLLYQFRFSNEVLELLEARAALAIPGNHDKTILHTRGHPLLTSPKVDPARLAYLASLPSSRDLRFGHTRVAMFHGAPWDDLEGPVAHYIYPGDHTLLRSLDEVGADVVVLGHTHVPMATRVGRTLVVNPGSAGEARDASRTISYAILETETEAVEFGTLPLVAD